MDRDTVTPNPPAPTRAHRIVFLGGLHRSGTSLLFRLLRNQPLVSGFENTGVPEDEGQHLQTVYPPAKAFGGEGRFGFSAGAHMTELPADVARATAATLFEQWSPYWDLDSPVLIEKSPPNIIRTRFLQSLFPEARFVIIVRHPLEVALAQRKRVGSQPVWSLLRHWFACHDTLAADVPHLGKYLSVRYEDLLLQPGRTLDDVLRFLDLSPVTDGGSGKIDTAEVSPAASDRYRLVWQRLTQNPAYGAYARLIVRRFEDDANRYGYSLRDFAPASKVRGSH
jgi:Sulfotransferase family